SRNSCTTRSMSSVVLPGLTAFPPSSRACAAIRQAFRMASMTSGDRTPSPVSRFGAFLPTYSGRAMEEGTGRGGDCTPGVNGARSGIAPAYDPSLPPIPAPLHWFAPAPRGPPRPRTRNLEPSCRHLACVRTRTAATNPGTGILEQHGRVTSDLPEPHPPIRGERGCVVGVDVQTRDATEPPHQPVGHGRGPRRSQSPAAIPRMHPHTLHLAHALGQRPDLGLEHDFALLEPGEGTTTGDQLGHPGAITGPSVTEPRVDAHLLAEHGHGRGEIDVDLVRPHRTHLGVGRD